MPTKPVITFRAGKTPIALTTKAIVQKRTESGYINVIENIYMSQKQMCLLQI